MLFIYFVRQMSRSRCVLGRQSLSILVGSPGGKECVGPSSYSSCWKGVGLPKTLNRTSQKPHQELGSDVMVSAALEYQGSRLDPAHP